MMLGEWCWFLVYVLLLVVYWLMVVVGIVFFVV